MFKSFLYFLFFISSLTGVFSQNNKVLQLKIEGIKKLKVSFIKKITYVKSGAPLDSLLIKKDIRILKRLSSISNANYEVIHKEGNLYYVVYDIDENFTIIPSVNFYTSNGGEFACRFDLSDFNFLGRNIVFGGFFQKDVYSSYGVHFVDPYLFSKRVGISLSYRDFTSQEPVFFDEGTVNYKYNNQSFEVLGIYTLNFINKLELGVNYFTENYQYKPELGDTAPPQDKQEMEVNKLLYKFIYDYNNLNYHYQYVSGFRSLFNFQYVTSLDDTTLPKFLIGWNDFLYYKRIGEKGNWANRLRFGLSTNTDSPFAPFSLDNNINIRGVGNTIDRGTGAIVLNSEYRYDIYKKDWFILQGNVFIDAGSWKNPGGNFSDFSKSKNIRIHPGMGLRFIHKKIFNAIIRIDYGHGITENDNRGLVFGIGQYF